MHDAPAAADPQSPCAVHTRRWVERFVVGLNLCPFAAPLLRDGDRGRLRIAVCTATDIEQLATAVLDELELLRATPEAELTTSLLVFERALADFDDYLDFLALAEDLLHDSGLEGSLQIASFHPDYQFEGSPVHDVANFTNRAPYPMLHFLREDTVSRALERYADPEAIPLRNIERLRALGNDAVRELLAKIEQDR